MMLGNVEKPDTKDGLVPTLNKMGFMTTSLDSYSQEFVDFSGLAQRPVVDIGAAYGIASLRALKKGAHVIANDIDERHLQVLKDQAPEEHRSRLALLPGAFPDELEIAAGSVDAVLACRIFHFLDGLTIERGIQKIFNWLAPGGKVFIVGETAYVKTTSSMIPYYEERVKQGGHRWPGYFDNIHELCPETRETLPPVKHFLDPGSLGRAFEAQGFVIERSGVFARPEFPVWLQLDGRESMGLIARKP